MTNNMQRNPKSYWTLTEAAAWVVFRDDAVVEIFSPPQPENWDAFMMYPIIENHEYTRFGTLNDLFDALLNNRLTAFARKNKPSSTVTEIPNLEWHDLVPDPVGPFRRLENGARDQPWLDIRVRRSEVEKLWRRDSEVKARTKFDWDVLEQLYRDIDRKHKKLTDNERISELQTAYQELYKREPPSRTSIQRHMKTWKTGPSPTNIDGPITG